MRRTVLFATLIPLLLGTAIAGTAEDCKTVIDLNGRILHALIVDNDATLFLAHADKDFMVVAAGAQSFDTSAISILGERVVVHGDTSVVVGLQDIDGTMAPVGKLGPMKFRAVFVRDDGGWRCCRDRWHRACRSLCSMGSASRSP